MTTRPRTSACVCQTIGACGKRNCVRQRKALERIGELVEMALGGITISRQDDKIDITAKSPGSLAISITSLMKIGAETQKALRESK